MPFKIWLLKQHSTSCRGC